MAKNSFLLFLLILPVAVFSQTTEDTLKFRLEKVTVTATRSPEQIFEIPYAVSLLEAKQLQNVKGYGLDEVLAGVPGVLAQSRSGNQDIRIIIRGFGARGAGDRSNSGTSRGLKIMIDGIPETEPDGRTAFDNIDISLADRIEVVRSNASAIWGNAAGGVIDISYDRPVTSPFAEITGFIGSYGLKKTSLQAGSPIGTGKVYAGVTNTTFDGWRQHSSSSRTLFNIGLNSNPAEKTKMSVLLLASSTMFHIPGPLNLSQYDSDPSQANATYLARDERRFNRLGKIGVTLDHSFDNSNSVSGMVFANPKFLQRSERGTFRDFTRYNVGGSLIYRNNSKLGENLDNRFTAGADESYQDGAILFYSLSATNGRGETLRTNKREGANSAGAFIQNEILIGEKVSVIAGGRYDNVTYYSEDFLAPEFGMQQKSFEKFTPKAGLTYRFSNTNSVYANLGGGVEVPAGNETDPAGTYGLDTVYLLNPLLDPIESTTFEIGNKNLLYFGSDNFLKYLNYEIALYHIIIKNDIIPYRGGRFYFTAGKSHRTGLEISLNAVLSYGISLNGAFTFSSNKYDSYKIDSAHYGNGGKFADFKDNKVAGIPDIFYNTGITFEPEGLGGLYLGASVSGTGKYFVDDANSIEVPAFYILNATLGLSSELKLTDHLGIRGFISVNNLFDDKYVGSAFINPDFVDGKPVYLEPGMPRNITASLMLGFN